MVYRWIVRRNQRLRSDHSLSFRHLEKKNARPIAANRQRTFVKKAKLPLVDLQHLSLLKRGKRFLQGSDLESNKSSFGKRFCLDDEEHN